MNTRRSRKRTVPTTIAGLLAVLIGLALTQWNKRPAPSQAPIPTGTHSPAPRSQDDPSRVKGSIVGWTSKASLQSHYQKHGNEFGDITISEYLRRAQALRDVPKGGHVIEIIRTDAVITRFNRQTGDFIAFNPNGTIRTYFHPSEGERYFRRQAEREQEDD